MHYIVLDLEWNQAVSAEFIRHNLSGEIIEIGAVKMSEDFVAEDTYKAVIRPVYYTKIKSRIARITGLNTRSVKDGLPFEKAYEEMLEWIGDEDYAYITWGLDDLPILRQNLLVHGMDDTALPICYNLQYIFDKQVTKDRKQWSLEDAQQTMGLESALSAHDALNDAIHTARICRKLDMKTGLEEYDPLPFRGKRSLLRETKFFGYRTRSQAAADPMIYSAVCPICGMSLQCSEYLPATRARLRSKGVCPRHGMFDVVIRFKKEEDGRITVYRSAIVDDPDLRKYYYGENQDLNIETAE